VFGGGAGVAEGGVVFGGGGGVGSAGVEEVEQVEAEEDAVGEGV